MFSLDYADNRHMTSLIKRKLDTGTLKVLCLLGMTLFVLPLKAERHEISLSIEVYDLSSQQTRMISPNDGYTFEILEKKGSRYKLKIFNRDGELIDDDFITHRSNVDDNFVKVEVESLLDSLADMADVGVPPKGDCLDEVLAEVEDLVEGDIRSECQVAGTNQAWKSNCEKLFDEGLPEDALKYALKVMKLNATSFKTNKCFDKRGLKHSGHTSMGGLTANGFKNDLMADGLPNKCTFIINDTDDRSPSSGGDNCRGRMYYIDMCSGGSPEVKKDYFNLGTGTCRNGRNGFMNESGKHTTVLGAFFTHTKAFDFTHTTTQTKQYSSVRRGIKNSGGPNRASALQLLGLQNTNNLSSKNGKYIHVSPHRSSWGCPSIAPENYYMIEDLASRGPSMVINYAKEGMEDIEECTEK